MLEVIESDLKMSTREIASLIKKSHSNIKISAERMAAGGTLALQESKFTHNGNEYTEYLLNKRDSTVLVAQNCPEFTAKLVDRWHELEVKLIDGNHTASNNVAPISDQLALLESFARTTNVSGSALLGMYQAVQENNGIQNILPNYAVDSNDGISSKITGSATELLKKNGVSISARAFNKLCIAHEILEVKTRPSTTKGTKEYKAITEYGMKYGKNETSPQNQKEVTPRWYEDSFSDLIVELETEE